MKEKEREIIFIYNVNRAIYKYERGRTRKEVETFPGDGSRSKALCVLQIKRPASPGPPDGLVVDRWGEWTRQAAQYQTENFLSLIRTST